MSRKVTGKPHIGSAQVRIKEKYSRGRRGAPAKGVGRATGARVQIPLSPFCCQSHKDRSVVESMLLFFFFPKRKNETKKHIKNANTVLTSSGGYAKIKTTSKFDNDFKNKIWKFCKKVVDKGDGMWYPIRVVADANDTAPWQTNSNATLKIPTTPSARMEEIQRDKKEFNTT